MDPLAVQHDYLRPAKCGDFIQADPPIFHQGAVLPQQNFPGNLVKVIKNKHLGKPAGVAHHPTAIHFIIETIVGVTVKPGACLSQQLVR